MYNTDRQKMYLTLKTSRVFGFTGHKSEGVEQAGGRSEGCPAAAGGGDGAAGGDGEEEGGTAVMEGWRKAAVT